MGTKTVQKPCIKVEMLDPVAADKIESNMRRTVRALEVILMTGNFFRNNAQKIPDQKFG